MWVPDVVQAIEVQELAQQHAAQAATAGARAAAAEEQAQHFEAQGKFADAAAAALQADRYRQVSCHSWSSLSLQLLLAPSLSCQVLARLDGKNSSNMI